MATREFVDVVTSVGRVRGAVTDGVGTFKGVPFAATTAGARRFRVPAPVEPWAGVRDALDYGPSCPQVDMTGGRRKRTEVVDGMTDPAEEGEDCLVVNLLVSVTTRAAR